MSEREVNGTAGVLLRSANGGTYFVPHSDLSKYRLADEAAAAVPDALKGSSAPVSPNVDKLEAYSVPLLHDPAAGAAGFPTPESDAAFPTPESGATGAAAFPVPESTAAVAAFPVPESASDGVAAFPIPESADAGAAAFPIPESDAVSFPTPETPGVGFPTPESGAS